jgi:hypothetical protein
MEPPYAERAGGTGATAPTLAHGSQVEMRHPSGPGRPDTQVVAAERGREFAFVVGGNRVRWSYTFAPVAKGTEVTETWEFLPAGIAMFEERFGDEAPTQVASRTEAARQGIPVTLEAIKRVADAE